MFKRNRNEKGQGAVEYLLILLLAGLVVAGIIFAVRSCSKSNDTDDVSPYYGETKYNIVYIKNMPCIEVHKTGYKTGYYGITCDWSQWEGE